MPDKKYGLCGDWPKDTPGIKGTSQVDQFERKPGKQLLAKDLRNRSQVLSDVQDSFSKSFQKLVGDKFMQQVHQNPYESSLLTASKDQSAPFLREKGLFTHAIEN